MEHFRVQFWAQKLDSAQSQIGPMRRKKILELQAQKQAGKPQSEEAAKATTSPIISEEHFRTFKNFVKCLCEMWTQEFDIHLRINLMPLNRRLYAYYSNI